MSDAQVEVIPLVHASAAEMARTLTMLADDKTAQANGENTRVFADARTNSILLSGAKNGRLQMRALIAHLDTPMTGGGDTQVIYLHYANAKDLVPILQGVASTLSGIAPPTALKAGDSAGGGERLASDDPGARGNQCTGHQRAAGDFPFARSGRAPARHPPQPGADRSGHRRSLGPDRERTRRAVAVAARRKTAST